MSYEYKVAVTRKNQIKYIDAQELGVYLQLGWQECTGLENLNRVSEQHREILVEDTDPDTTTHTEQPEEPAELEASAVLKPVKRRK